MPIHHAQLHICISNPEGVKVPQFVILDKRQSVYQGLILSSLKQQGAWMGATPPRSLCNELKFQTPDDKTGQGK